MPLDLPFPQSPNYCCGRYGGWTLEEKFGASFERGYFTGFDVEPPGHYLENDGDIWMSTSRLERESHAVHLKHAKGNVVVCGVGMGMYLYNIASKPSVERIVAVDLDANVINLVQHATAFESWLGREKIRFVNKDALQLDSADIGVGASRLPVRRYLAGTRYGRGHFADSNDSIGCEGSESWMVGSGDRLHRLAFRSQAERTSAGDR